MCIFSERRLFCYACKTRTKQTTHRQTNKHDWPVIDRCAYISSENILKLRSSFPSCALSHPHLTLKSVPQYKGLSAFSKSDVVVFNQGEMDGWLSRAKWIRPFTMTTFFTRDIYTKGCCLSVINRCSKYEGSHLKRKNNNSIKKQLHVGQYNA